MADQKKEQETKPALGGGIEQAQLDAWKEKYGQVNIVAVHLDDKTILTGYFKKPGRDVLANCINMANTERIYEAREFLLNNTFIGGDKEITTHYDASLAAQINLWKALNFLKAEVTKY